MSKNFIAWAIYGLFAALALYFNWHDHLFLLTGQLGVIKLVIALVYIGFLIYSYHCSMYENIFRSVASMAKLHWGRQIMIDLYLGLLLSLLIIFLHQGLWVMALWTLPILAFGNLATLLYVLIHFDSLVSHFLI